MSDELKIPNYRCPGSINHPHGNSENAVLFRPQPNGDLRCGFCGSLHPVQFMELVDHILEYKCEDKIYLSEGKIGKIYIKRPDVKNADDGCLKFYTNHLFTVPEFIDRMEAGRIVLKEEIVEKANQAVAISKKYFDETVLPGFRRRILKDKVNRDKN